MLSHRQYKILHTDDLDNDLLFEFVKSKIVGNVTGATKNSIGGRKTYFDLHEYPETRPLLDYAASIMPLIADNFCMARDKPELTELGYSYNIKGHEVQGGGLYGFDPRTFELAEMWGVMYNKGHGVSEHNHFPFSLSFIYYVRTPSGSAPLILDDTELQLKEGDMIFFNGCLYHSVVNNDCEGRCVITGNICYVPPDNPPYQIIDPSELK